jgi:hypothetical protein
MRYGAKQTGILVVTSKSLMSINYARAAAADFAAMQAAFARRWINSDSDARAALDQTVKSLSRSFADDLKIAAERSQSVRAAQAAANVQQAASDWDGVRLRLLSGTEPDINWETLDRYTAIVDQQIDLLINYTAATDSPTGSLQAKLWRGG